MLEQNRSQGLSLVEERVDVRLGVLTLLCLSI